jgi:hypothetical protein
VDEEVAPGVGGGVGRVDVEHGVSKDCERQVAVRGGRGGFPRRGALV